MSDDDDLEDWRRGVRFGLVAGVVMSGLLGSSVYLVTVPNFWARLAGGLAALVAVALARMLMGRPPGGPPGPPSTV